jgi:hypothetical protein
MVSAGLPDVVEHWDCLGFLPSALFMRKDSVGTDEVTIIIIYLLFSVCICTIFK